MNDSNRAHREKRESIIACVNNGRLEQAKHLCQDLCRTSNSVDSWLLMAEIHARMASYPEIAECCQRVIKLQPDNIAARYNLGVALQIQGKHAQATEQYRALLRHAPDNTDALTNLGLSLRTLRHTPEAIEILTRAVDIRPDLVVAWNNLGLCLRDQREFGKAEAAFRRALSIQPDSAEAQCNLGLCLTDLGHLDDAIDAFRRALDIAPDYMDALIGMSVALRRAMRTDEAIGLLRNALGRQPQNPQLHYALANTLRASGNLQAAIDSYKITVRLEPRHFQALNNLGSLLQEANQLHEAEGAYRAALQLQPKEASIQFNLSTALSEQGRYADAVVHSRIAIALSPEKLLFRQQFAKQVASCPVDSLDDATIAEILRTYYVPGIDYQRLASPTLAVLKRDPQFRKLMKLAHDSDTARIEECFRKREFTDLIRNPLLRALLVQTVVHCADTEILFTQARKALLLLVMSRPRTLSDDEVDFIAALACQCGNNEFVYIEDEEENTLVSNLSSSVASVLSSTSSSDLASQQLPLAALGMYRVLAELEASERLNIVDTTTWNPVVRTLIERQVLQRIQEKTIRRNIPRLTEIRDTVSGRVREQYEESPYPRWLGIDLLEPEPYTQILKRTYPHLDLPQRTESPIDVLIAGCGTGKHAILSKTRFANSSHLAVDLSSASLAYAQRKANELGLENLRFMQADILELHNLEQRFHIIESVGVLHHMEDPGAGLKTLTGLLRPGGLMNIGLYSALARRHITAARERFATTSSTISLDRIRHVRRQIIEMDMEDPIRQVMSTSDFFSLSDCRDLLFHVQEHCLTLPDIADLLREHQLRFIGFEHSDPQIKHQYTHAYPQDPDRTDLQCWNTFEQAHPDTFIGMYVFWCQKQ